MGIELYKMTIILSKVLTHWQIDPEIMPNFAVAKRQNADGNKKKQENFCSPYIRLAIKVQ